MSDALLRQATRETIKQLETGTVGTLEEAIESLYKVMSSRGLGPNCHNYNVKPEDPDIKKVEWYAGQILSAAEQGFKDVLLANTLIHFVDKFCPKE